jgi:hypothetical protein
VLVALAITNPLGWALAICGILLLVGEVLVAVFAGLGYLIAVVKREVEKNHSTSCLICRKECHEALLHLGGNCSEKHCQEIVRRRQELLQELRGEKAGLLPAFFTQPVPACLVVEAVGKAHLLPILGRRQPRRRITPGDVDHPELRPGC